ncbi:SCO7613 C-terminal domain-containing membrane protein [Streptomyces winkii]|uniref:SCO7613 C-terminal domain-containing membrane protein n=1 Tax=Streptomyces winkii TaxID=3051178 RepID=UPI0028D1EDB1|nr:hypothetical protein [Streptomyces sp. DSM 40971]
MEYKQPFAHCPDCGGPLGQSAGHAEGQGLAQCPYCRLPLTGAEHGEVRRIDEELTGLERRRAALLGRRQALLAGLRASAQGAAHGASAHGASAQGAAAAGPFGPVPGHGPVPRPWAAGRAETSSYTARNVLLVLGGVLLTVAAFAFTLLNWGSMGVGGRAAVLGGLTLGTLAVPLWLLRRELVATAESVAGFGLALLVLDAYALHEVAFPYADGLRFAASSTALIAALWAGYGLALPAPGLRLPLPFAVVVAQLPLPLSALSLDGSSDRTAYGLAVALLLTVAADVALAVSHLRDGIGTRATARPVRLTAAVAAVPVGALLMGVTLWHQPDGVVSAARWSAVQAVAAAVLLYAGQRHQARRLAGPLGTAAGLVLIAALGSFGWAVVEAGGPAGRDWWVLVHLLCAMGLLGAVLVLRVVRAWRAPQSAGLCVAAVVVQCGALLWTLAPVAEAVFGPWFFVKQAWEGPPRGPVRQAVDGEHAWTGSAATLLVLLLLALSVTLLARVLGGAARDAQRPSGEGVLSRLPVLPPLPVLLALCACIGAAAPPALGLSYGPTVTVVSALAVVLLAAAVTAADSAAGVTALVSGLTLAVTAIGWALAQQAATLAVLTLLCVASAAAAVRSPKGGPGRRAALAASAVAHAAGLAGALAAAVRLPAHQASFAVLAVVVGTVPVAAWLRGGPAGAAPEPRRAISLAVECTGYAAALAALGLCAPRPDTLWLALAVCAVSAAGVALRADRRPGAGLCSAALLVLATWVRLFASAVSTPEAYTLPVSVALLLIGWLHRRRTGGSGEGSARPRISSWRAYGGGLAFTFLPSLVMVWSDPHWLRPLLLGTGALATTLAGARRRTQAPLLLGGATLVSVGAHELAPYVAQVAWLLPRWLMPALAGLLLVVTGATYERRLEEARRLKHAWQRLS